MCCLKQAAVSFEKSVDLFKTSVCLFWNRQPLVFETRVRLFWSRQVPVSKQADVFFSFKTEPNQRKEFVKNKGQYRDWICYKQYLKRCVDLFWYMDSCSKQLIACLIRLRISWVKTVGCLFKTNGRLFKQASNWFKYLVPAFI